MNDPGAQGLLAELGRRVDEALSTAARAVEELHDADVAAGAGAVEVVALCEAVVRVAQGVQADAVLQLDARRREWAGPDVHERDLCRSLFAEIGMARQVSASAGESSYRLATDLVSHPEAHALLRDGVVNQAVVAAVCRETVFLAPDQQVRVDAALAPQLDQLGPKRAAAAARRLVVDAEPHAAYERTIRARSERHVSLRREQDAMVTLSVYGPAEQLVAAYERLDAGASARRCDGDPRTIAQLSCDLVVEALTGCGVASDGTAAVGVEVGVLMRPETLFGADDSSAVLTGYGPVPAELARRLAGGERSWLRRFFTRPDGHRPEAVDPRRRRFPAAVRRLVLAADGDCARPWCECRVREIDHVVPYARGGPTTLDNADGDCRSDNLLKETRGWRVDRDLDGVRVWTTPTGHRYETSRSLPGQTGSSPAWVSPIEEELLRLVAELPE